MYTMCVRMHTRTLMRPSVFLFQSNHTYLCTYAFILMHALGDE